MSVENTQAYILMLRDERPLTDNQRFAIAAHLEQHLSSDACGEEARPVGLIPRSDDDPRKVAPHEYVSALNHNGCAVCGLGIGAARHNTSEINCARREASMPKPQKVIEYNEITDRRRSHRLSLLAPKEFNLVTTQQGARFWFDDLEGVHYKEVLHSDHSQWFQEND